MPSEEKIKEKIAELQKQDKHKNDSDADLESLAKRLVGGEEARDKKKANAVRRKEAIASKILEAKPDLAKDEKKLEKAVDNAIDILDLEAKLKETLGTYNETLIKLENKKQGKGDAGISREKLKKLLEA